jgi:hypothetical protein
LFLAGFAILPVRTMRYTPAGSRVGAGAAVTATTTLKATAQQLRASAAGSAGPECAALGDPAKEAVPAKDFISVDRKRTQMRVFADPLAEFVAPPMIRHHTETSSTMIADFGAH